MIVVVAGAASCWCWYEARSEIMEHFHHQQRVSHSRIDVSAENTKFVPHNDRPNSISVNNIYCVEPNR